METADIVIPVERYSLVYESLRNKRPRTPRTGPTTPAQVDSHPPDPVNLAEHQIRRKQVLGGLTHE